MRGPGRSEASSVPRRAAAAKGDQRSPLPPPVFEHHLGWTRERALQRLESPERLRSGEADRLWGLVGLAAGERVADVGAGTGYFAFPAAARVGRGGRVYAIDVSPELIGLLEDRRRARHLSWLTVVRSSPARIPLPSGIADVVLLANLLHGIPRSTLAEAARLLANRGRLVVADWEKKRSTGHGPPLERRLSRTAARRRLATEGLVTVAEGRLGRDHYLLVAARPVGRVGGARR